MTRQQMQDRKTTGKIAAQWFALMEDVGARQMVHKDIAHRIGETHPEISGWWAQMITVLYEQERGMREKHQTTSGYQVSASKTMSLPLERLYEAWISDELRRQWLEPEAITVRSATPQKYLHMAWNQDKSSVDTNFYPNGENKSQVTVRHSKLPDAEAGEKMKAFTGGADWTACSRR